MAEYLKVQLERSGYTLDLAVHGRMGLSMAKQGNYDMIVSDVDMPWLDGYKLCEQLRDWGYSKPIMLLTSLGEKSQVVEGLNVGADDYLAKPFDIGELQARIKALLRRHERENPKPPVYTLADLKLDSGAKTVERAGELIKLTAREFSLLETLMRNQGQVLSRLDLSKEAWGIDFDTQTNNVDVYINYLRKKVDKGYSQKLIHTVTGMGYVLREPLPTDEA